MAKKQKSLTKRLLFVNISITMIVLIITESLFMGYYVISQKNIMQNEVQDLTQTVVSQVDNSIHNLDDIGLQLSTNSYIIQQMLKMKDGEYVYDPYSDSNGADEEMKSLILSYNIRRDMVSRICIYNYEGIFIDTSSNIKDDFSWSKDRLTQLAEKFKNGATVVYEVNQEDLLGKDNAYGYISVIRPVRNSLILGSTPVGYVEVQLSLGAIKSSLNKLLLPDFNIQLMTNHNQTELLSLTNDSSTHKNLAITKNVDIYGGLLSVKLTNNCRNFYRYIIDMATAIIILFVILAICIIVTQKTAIRKITLPLIELFEQTKNIGLEKASKTLPINNNENEIEGLRDSFQSMIVALQVSSKQLVAAQTGKLKAQLLAMQSQIDPHFIHNTLAVVSAYAKEQDYQKIEEIVENLSQMIRYSTNFETPFCTMGQEIDHLRSYLNLISIRYEENFQFEIRCTDNINRCRIPHFIVQPIAENALTHSLKYKEYPWKINIECEVNNYHWRIIVEDNGIGITQDKANEVMLETYEAIEKGSDYLIEQLKIGGLSLLNIVGRLYLHYKEDMVFCISPVKGGGTKVIIGGNVSEI